MSKHERDKREKWRAETLRDKVVVKLLCPFIEVQVRPK